MKNLKHAKILAAVALAALLPLSAQAGYVDLSTPDSTTIDGNGGSVTTGANSLALTATSSATYSVTNLLSFDWIFDTEDYLNFNDFGAFMTTSLGQVVIANVADTGNVCCGNSSSINGSYGFAAPYTGAITFSSVNVNDTLLDSVFTVSNLKVPEPGSLGLLGMALLALGGAARRRRAS